MNTTAPLYAQGSVVAYRVPVNADAQSTLDSQYVATGTLPAPGPVVYTGINRQTSCPPKNAAEALRLAGSLQWSAKDGYYGVMPMVTMDNAPSRLQYSNFHVIDTSVTPNRLIGGEVRSQAIGANTYWAPWYSFPVPFDMIGAYFTGLSPQTTLLS